jgi:hypothetical protein
MVVAALVVLLLAVVAIVLVVVGGETPPDDPDDPDGQRAPDDAEGSPDPIPAVSAPSWSVSRPYSDDSPWNTPLDDDIAVHPRSAELVARIGDELTSDTSQYTLPVYEVDGDTPTAPVRVVHLFSDVVDDGTAVDRRQEATVEVPIPEEAVAAAGTDAQIVILDTDTGEEWGFWQLQPEGDGYVATNGYRYHLGWNGVPPDGFGSRGAGVTYLAGLIRPESIEAGRIEHAIAFAYPTPSPEHVFPATKSDGGGDADVDLPEGARLRLDPSLTEDELAELGLSDEGLVIARALQEYGMILIDVAGRPKIYAEYEETAGWDGAITEDTVRALPLDRFEVVDWDEQPVPPMAMPSAPDEVPHGSELVLDGSASYEQGGDVTAYEWSDADGEVLGESEHLRVDTAGFEPGWHRFGLRVAGEDGSWSGLRQLYVEVTEEAGPFVASTAEAVGVEVQHLDVLAPSAGPDEPVLVGVVLRRLNEDDDVEVTSIEGGGREWTQVSRTLDERGTLALEVWSGAPGGGSDGAGDLRIELSDTTNVAAQVLALAGVEEASAETSAVPTGEPGTDSEVAIDGAANGLVVGFVAGRTEDLEPSGDAEPNALNTEAGDGGGSVRLSSLVIRPSDAGPVELGGTTRSPMDWVAAALAHEPRG